jgi:hypothetical protein
VPCGRSMSSSGRQQTVRPGCQLEARRRQSGFTSLVLGQGEDDDAPARTTSPVVVVRLRSWLPSPFSSSTSDDESDLRLWAPTADDESSIESERSISCKGLEEGRGVVRRQEQEQQARSAGPPAGKREWKSNRGRAQQQRPGAEINRLSRSSRRPAACPLPVSLEACSRPGSMGELSVNWNLPRATRVALAAGRLRRIGRWRPRCASKTAWSQRCPRSPSRLSSLRPRPAGDSGKDERGLNGILAARDNCCC